MLWLYSNHRIITLKRADAFFAEADVVSRALNPILDRGIMTGGK